MENYHFLEKMSHFDRERIPERVVHARGTTSFGYFEATGKVGDEPISKYTRAKLFQEAGKQTELAVRFSTVAGGRDSSEAIRDPRGFAVKFYTEDGNWDLVGNNLGVFFIRDAIKFPDFIHSQKPDPVSFERQVPNRVFDFISQSPESMHMVTLVFGPRGVPASYRTMQGFGVNTYKWVNEAGETKLVKYHWHPKQGVKSWTEDDAGDHAGPGARLPHAGPLRGDRARRATREWELFVQMMDDHDHPELDWDPLDDTKVWPENDFPLRHVGTMMLNRTPENFFAENEQIAFGTGVLVDGLDFSDDKMLVGRTFSYSRHAALPGRAELPAAAGQRAQERAAGDQPARLADGLLRRRRRARTRASTTSRRSPAACAEAPKPAHDEQGPGDQRAPDARADPAHRRLPPGRRALPALRAVGEGRPGRQPRARCWASATGRSRSAWSGTCCCATTSSASASARASASPPTTSARLKPLPTQGWGEAEQQRLDNLGNNGPRDVEGLEMTHCVPNEHAALTEESVGS